MFSSKALLILGTSTTFFERVHLARRASAGYRGKYTARQRACGLRAALLVLLILGGGPLPPRVKAEAGDDEQPAAFARVIRPILADKCFQCHGPDEESREADLRLDTQEGATADLGGYAAVVPGDPEQSALYERIRADDDDVRMPPPDSGMTLSDNEIEQLRRWIASGAPWQEHWSFVPPRSPDLPEVSDGDWPRNTVDHFVLSRLDAAGLRPSPEADRRTLVRRLFLDLTGLPPSIEEVEQFVDDPSPKAYERLVDRLLRCRHYGERMAIAWLDQARYADTNGYSIDGGRHMWLWRDWVIAAYNRNMPFNQFVVEQLAGDLLPDATVQQRVATGFNRNHMITHEGGTIPEENLANYCVDRVKTTGEVFLGLTIGCAQCHEHKYDPISQREYYRFYAFFNTLSDRGLDGDNGVNARPSIEARSPLASDEEIAQTRQELARLKQQLRAPHTGQAAWEARLRRELAERGRDHELFPVEVLKVSTPNASGVFAINSGGYVLVSPDASGHFPQISMRVDVPRITGFRIEFLHAPDQSDDPIGYGKALEGSFVLTGMSVSATEIPADQTDLYNILPIRRVTASASHADYPPQDCLDERSHNGWSPHPDNNTPQHITFTFDEPIDTQTRPYLTATLTFLGGGYPRGEHLMPRRFRLYAMTGNDTDTNVPTEVQEILAVDPANRTDEQLRRIHEYFAATSDEMSALRYRTENVRNRLGHLTEPHPAMVMDTAGQPRHTFVLERGQYDRPAEAVDPGVPAFLPQLQSDWPANRLGLAYWLTEPAHPLTARVAVNRVWQLLFGAGIVSSSSDFGTQGAQPTHPDLLDWLAVDFADNGWNVKRLVKMIVMSATYRQSSRTSPEMLKRDPNNRLLARGPRFRLPAELIRDLALKVSGLLICRVGGPSVKPYQPPGLWKEISHFGSTLATAQVFVQDHGESLYRRSLYTYWKRTVPPPAMVAFDAPTREICTMQRSATNTPLQALVLLNDPQFVEAARALAERVLREGPSDPEARLAYAFVSVLSRQPTSEELAVMRTALNGAREDFLRQRASALVALSVGETPCAAEVDPVEHAAWMQVASLLLNLSETITRE